MASNSLKWTTSELDNFDYTSLEPETRVVVEQCASEIKALARNTAQNIIDIGLRIIEIKKHLKHGHYRRWLAAEFPWRKSAANVYERAAKKFSNVQSLDKFDLSAFYVLVCGTTPEIACEEALARASQGEYMTLAKVNSIVNQYKETRSSNPCETLTVDVSSEELEPEQIVFSADQDGLDLSSQIVSQSTPEPIAETISLDVEQDIDSVEILSQVPPAEQGVENQRAQVGDRLKNAYLNRFRPVTNAQEKLGTAHWDDGYVATEILSNPEHEAVDNTIPLTLDGQTQGLHIDAAEAAIVTEPVGSQSINLPRILQLEIEESGQTKDTAQTFELMVWLQAEGASHSLIALFEQLQNNPIFAEDVLRQANDIASTGIALSDTSSCK